MTTYTDPITPDLIWAFFMEQFSAVKGKAAHHTFFALFGKTYILAIARAFAAAQQQHVVKDWPDCTLENVLATVRNGQVNWVARMLRIQNLEKDAAGDWLGEGLLPDNPSYRQILGVIQHYQYLLRKLPRSLAAEERIDSHLIRFAGKLTA